MMLGSEHLIIPLRLAAVLVPVAVYFLVLGLLNSRRHPQLLRARHDFLLLIVAMSPMVLLPAAGRSALAGLIVVLAGGLIAALVWVITPRGPHWVIYNVHRGQAHDAVRQALKAMGQTVRATPERFERIDHAVSVDIGVFPLLRNVSVRIRGPKADELAEDFEHQLAASLQAVSVEPSPMAISLLLVATAMLVAPLTLLAPRAGQIVRLMTDLLF